MPRPAAASREPDPGHLPDTTRTAAVGGARALLVGDHAAAAAGVAGIPCLSALRASLRPGPLCAPGLSALRGFGQPAEAQHCSRAATITRVPGLAAALLPSPGG